MNKYCTYFFTLFFVCVFLGCGSVENQSKQNVQKERTSKDLNSKTYIKVIGTEPFWDIQIAEDNIVFTSVEGNYVEFPYNIPEINSFSKDRFYNTVNGNGTLTIKLTKEICSDGMSDRIYDFKAEVEMVQMKKKSKFRGCAYFIAHDFLSGTWILKQLKTSKIKGENKDDAPFIEFDIENNKISGNAGCNGLSASYSMKGDEIKFDDILLTRMFCREAVESEMVKILSEVSSYRVEGNQLKFYKNDILEMLFEKQ